MAKKTYELAPGSILVNMYLENALEKNSRRGQRFLEIGSGRGVQANLLLDSGLNGVGTDLNPDVCEANRELNAEFVANGQYEVSNSNFFEFPEASKFDVIISRMVLEHLTDEDLDIFFTKARALLNPGGVVISIVPASMRHWGIEDEVAGHYRRFEFEDFEQLAQKHNFHLKENSGLTFPVTNILLPLGNHLIKKREENKKKLSYEERTYLSSSRDLNFKKDFPVYFKLLLNRVTMYPFYILQTLARKSRRSTIIYSELEVR